jgi:putative tricarboxylic transport membrane protein
MSPDGRVDRIVGATLLLAGGAMALEATTFNVLFLTDPVGPKALPLVAAAIFLMSGARLLLRPRSTIALPERAVALRMGAAALAFGVYAAVMTWIGFFAGTSLVVFVLARLYRGPTWPSAAASLAVAGALWVLFVAILSLPLPVGDLWIR